MNHEWLFFIKYYNLNINNKINKYSLLPFFKVWPLVSQQFCPSLMSLSDGCVKCMCGKSAPLCCSLQVLDSFAASRKVKMREGRKGDFRNFVHGQRGFVGNICRCYFFFIICQWRPIESMHRCRCAFSTNGTEANHCSASITLLFCTCVVILRPTTLSDSNVRLEDKVPLRKGRNY